MQLQVTPEAALARVHMLRKPIRNTVSHKRHAAVHVASRGSLAPTGAPDASAAAAAGAELLSVVEAARKAGCPFFRVAAPPAPSGPLDSIREAWTSAVEFVKFVAEFPTQDPLERQKQIMAGQEVVPGRFMGAPVTYIGPLPLAKAVLTSEEHFRISYPRLLEAFGADAILFKEGGEHARIRGLLAPFFNLGEIDKYTPRVQELAAKQWAAMARLAEGVSDPSQAPPASRYTQLFTLEVICRVVGGLDVTDEELPAIMEESFQLFLVAAEPVTLDLPFTPYGKALAASRRMTARIEGWIADAQQRITAGEQGRSVLDDLVRYRDAEGNQLTQEELVSNIKSFVGAGSDTTAATLNDLLFYLHTHPQFLAGLREEQAAIIEQHGHTITPAALAAMKRTANFVKETLRLKPVSTMLMREAVHDVGVQGSGQQVIRKGELAVLNLNYGAVQDPVWVGQTGECAPEAFNPDRWLQPAAKDALLLPFGWGRHICLGKNLALMELRVALAVLVRDYDIVAMQLPRHWVQTSVHQPENGLPTLLRRRSASAGGTAV